MLRLLCALKLRISSQTVKTEGRTAYLNNIYSRVPLLEGFRPVSSKYPSTKKNNTLSSFLQFFIYQTTAFCCCDHVPFQFFFIYLSWRLTTFRVFFLSGVPFCSSSIYWSLNWIILSLLLLIGSFSKIYCIYYFLQIY